MLTVTPVAAQAVEALVAPADAPDSAGVRIARAGDDPNPTSELGLAIVEEPLPGDQRVPDAPVFLEPEVAPLLDDKVLDADVSGERVRFTVHE